MKKVKYYFISATVAYDGLEWINHAVVERKGKFNVDKEAKYLFGHEDVPYEEIKAMEPRELTKAEYDVMKKYI